MAKQAADQHKLSVRADCETFLISQTCYRYQPKLSEDNARHWQLLMTAKNGMITLYLALQNISKKWTMPIRNWKSALNQFAIIFEDRMPTH